MTEKKIGWKNIRTLGVIGFFVIVSIVWQEEIMSILKKILGFDQLKYIMGIAAIIITLTSSYIKKKFVIEDDISLRQFNKIFDEITSIIGSPVAMVCAFSLANALIHFWTDDEKYFPLFDKAEITVLTYIALYLVITSSMELYSKLMNIIFIESSKSEMPKAVKGIENSKIEKIEKRQQE